MASNDSTFLIPSEMSATNMTEPVLANLNLTEKLAILSAFVWENRDMFILETRIVFTALACIYVGSHAALRRPPSANPPKKGSKGGRRHQQDRDDKYVQGLEPSDAILFPIMAAVVLVGLYYLIKWLEDPDILNKILSAYFSFMSLASIGKLLADSLHFLTGFAFPTVWISYSGRLYHIDPSRKGQWYTTGESADQVLDDKKKNPLPGWFSGLPLTNAQNTLLWGVRHLLMEEWTVRLSIHGIANETFKVKFNDILGAIIAVGSNLVYYTTKSNLLSNFMGLAFSYAAIIVMSPTTFATGTAVLFGLFFYDIYMVFYTPYMVTVATKLEVPIKLVFQGASKASMLGLGDIVLPGIFVALCLRFDHYMYYHRQRKLVPVELKVENESSGQLVTDTRTRHMVVKPDYVNPQGQWGDWLWGTELSSISSDATPALKASAFPKPYFHAAMFGYLLAMVMTLVMLIVYRHAQPALLYLVPGVVFAAWVTGILRGELREMWAYTEDGRLDTTDTIVEVDGNGNVIDVTREDKNDKKDDKGEKGEKGEKNLKTEAVADADADAPPDMDSIEQDTTVENEVDKIVDEKINEKISEMKRKLDARIKEKGHTVFHFSIEAPPATPTSGS
ncbi:signal peptide peptidase-domain-containing protein [Hypoxylon sp. NC1633]|nr:signal peptide peptidase-domain-containing protein [Hypoxylon sp. NC1633]